jgi:hypothetical protein
MCKEDLRFDKYGTSRINLISKQANLGLYATLTTNIMPKHGL